MTNKRNLRILGLALLISVGGTTAAWAGTGTYTPSAKQITFFYKNTSGDGDSNDFAGGGSRTFSGDVPASDSSATYVAEYRHNRTLQTDQVISNFSSNYYNAQVNKSVSTASGSNYHVHAVWNYSPVSSGNPSGFVRSS